MIVGFFYWSCVLRISNYFELTNNALPLEKSFSNTLSFLKEGQKKPVADMFQQGSSKTATNRACHKYIIFGGMPSFFTPNRQI